MGLSARSGWNQTEQDWRRLLALEPEGCFCMECDGVVAATTTAVCYGRELAWIGMVLTAPEYRGRGFARLLMERTLDFLAGRGVERIKLDATEMGAPLYRKLGFEDECPIERWIREPGLSMEAGQLEAGFDPALDRESLRRGSQRAARNNLARIGSGCFTDRFSRWPAPARTRRISAPASPDRRMEPGVWWNGSYRDTAPSRPTGIC
jgi:GNAT superfamily N-acetyltransferase